MDVPKCNVCPKPSDQRVHKLLAARQRFEEMVVPCREALTQQMTACELALRVDTRMPITALHSLDVAPLCLRERALC